MKKKRGRKKSKRMGKGKEAGGPGQKLTRYRRSIP